MRITQSSVIIDSTTPQTFLKSDSDAYLAHRLYTFTVWYTGLTCGAIWVGVLWIEFNQF